MKNKAHLTEKGLDQIRLIKMLINKGIQNINFILLNNFFFYFCMINLIIVILGAFTCSSIVLSVAFTIFMFRIVFGGYSFYLNILSDLNRREILYAFLSCSIYQFIWNLPLFSILNGLIILYFNFDKCN